MSVVEPTWAAIGAETSRAARTRYQLRIRSSSGETGSRSVHPTRIARSGPMPVTGRAEVRAGYQPKCGALIHQGREACGTPTPATCTVPGLDESRRHRGWRSSPVQASAALRWAAVGALTPGVHWPAGFPRARPRAIRPRRCNARRGQASEEPPAPVPDRRLRADLSRLLRDDRPAADL